MKIDRSLSVSVLRARRASLLRSTRAMALPIALAGSLLLFGARGVGAADTATFDMIGETITVQGSYSAEMVGRSIHVQVASGTARLQIVGKQEIDLIAGDDIMLVPMTNGTLGSIGVRVLAGEAMVGPVAGARDS